MEECFVYISGPITAKHGRSVEQNVADALPVYFELIRRGIPCFCPHLAAGFPSAFTDVDYEQWLRYDYAMILRSTHVLRLPRWELSSGAQQEVAFAGRHGIHIVDSIQELVHALRYKALHEDTEA